MSSAMITARLTEVWLLTGRSMRHLIRVPERLAGTVLLGIVFVLMFAYVFGSAIKLPGGGDYHSYLVSGVLAQTMMSPLPGIAVGVAGDMRSGIVDRLRTLPIGRASLLAGRAIGELVEVVIGVSVIAICGLLIGWAPHGSVLDTVVAFGLLIVFGFAAIWVGLFVGLLVRDAEAADGVAMSLFFPLMFLSGIFVPIGGLPEPIRTIAEWNPLSVLATATRDLLASPQPPLPDVWPLQHPIAGVLLWSALLVAVFAPLSIRRYRRIGA